MTTIQAEVIVPRDILNRILGDGTSKHEIFGKKGPVFATSIVAGVQGVKRTSEWIPFCHPLSIDACDINIALNELNHIQIDCSVKTFGKTGVEMEALVGASNAALCVYDMLKALSHDIVIKDIRLIKKTGGKSDYKI